MSIYQFDNYKKWTLEKLQSDPSGGRGALSRLAKALHTSSTTVTQVFKGDRELTPEQAVLLSEYFALSKLESRYLLLLVNFSRAGSHRYRLLLEEEIKEIRLESKKVSNRVPVNTELNEETKAVLYSNWAYLAVWSIIALEKFQSAEAIAKFLEIEKKRAAEIITFLKNCGLIIEKENSSLKVGPTLIHIGPDSPFLIKHHHNWRMQAMRHQETPRTGEVFYTAPVTLSNADAVKLQEKILSFISECVDLIKDSPSEEFFCLNVDWFKPAK